MLLDKRTYKKKKRNESNQVNENFENYSADEEIKKVVLKIFENNMKLCIKSEKDELYKNISINRFFENL